MIVQLDPQETGVSVQYWKQERLIFRVPTKTGEPVRVYDDHGTIANYTGFGSYIDIDLTDWVRANEEIAARDNVYISTIIQSGGFDVDVEWGLDIQVAGLISPDSVLKPDSNVFHFPIVAPTKYIGGEDTICEVYTDYGSPNPLRSSAWGWYDNQGVWNRSALSMGLHALQVDSSYKMIAFGSMSSVLPDGYTIIPIQEQECEVTYALVRWVSFTGGTKQHVFELVRPKTSVADAYSLEPIDNEFVEIKGRVDGFTLKLDNLSPYDMWYYSDVLTSSKVEVSLDHGATFDRVQVTNKDMTLLPNGNMSNGVIEFNVNWRRYDAVSM